MSRNYSANFVWLIFTVVVLCMTTVAGQTNLCNLKLNVIQNEDRAVVENATAVLVSEKTSGKIKSTSKDGMPYFAKLPVGKYSVVVGKKEYKQTSKNFNLDCESVNEQNVASEIIFLWKGDTKQTIKVFDGSFTTANGSTILTDTAGLVKPSYPRAARAVKATGAVNVRVMIDELGDVVSAKAVSGHPLLQSAAVQAAKASKFETTRLQGIPVKITGIIVYNFVP